MVWHVKLNRYVLTSKKRGKFIKAIPQEDSSRFVIVTTQGSFAGQVEKFLKAQGYTFWSGAKFRENDLCQGRHDYDYFGDKRIEHGR